MTGGRDHRITYRPAARHEPTESRGYRITPRTPARDTAHDGPDYHRGSYRTGAGDATHTHGGRYRIHVTPPRGGPRACYRRPCCNSRLSISPPPLFAPSPATRCRAIGPPSGNAPCFFCSVDRRLGCLCRGSPGTPGRRHATPSHLYHWPPRTRGCRCDAPAGPPPRLSSVPPKLICRITSLEFVDMWELLPELWHVDSASQSGCCPHTKRPRRGMVTDILVWAECYATMAAILSAAYPNKAPHFFAYLRTITRASRNFEGTAWASYDVVFRRQAANRRSLEWGIVDTEAYNEAFTGRARVIPRCVYCLGDTHASHECAFAPAQAPGPVHQLMFPHPYPPPPPPPPRPGRLGLQPMRYPQLRDREPVVRRPSCADCLTALM